VSGDITTNGQRKGVPNSRSGNSEAARTETWADMGNEQQGEVDTGQSERTIQWPTCNRLSNKFSNQTIHVQVIIKYVVTCFFYFDTVKAWLHFVISTTVKVIHFS